MKDENLFLAMKTKDWVKAFEYRYNPLKWIRLGTPYEISDARKLANEIVLPLDIEPKIAVVMVELLTTVILHNLYAQYSDSEHYPISPNLMTIVNFLKVNIVEEERANIFGRRPSIYDVHNDHREFDIYAKSFVETLEGLMNFEHVPWNGIEMEYWDENTSDFNQRHFDCDMMHELYPEFSNIYKINPYIHPWIYQNFVLFYENSEVPIFEEALFLAPLAIDNYLGKHPEYREPVSNYLKKEQEKRKNKNCEFMYKPVEKEKKGRKLKPVKEIIKDIIKQVF